jgi:hypothetical protein
MRLLAAKMPHSIHFDEAYLFQRGFHPLAGTMSTILVVPAYPVPARLVGHGESGK